MNKISFWFRNARPISLPQSMLPALTAVALSAGTGNFSWIAAVVCVIGVMFAHLGMNLLDDWFDYYKGSGEARLKTATEGFRGRMTKYPYLTSGEATPKQLLVAVCVFLGIAALMGCVVLAIRGSMILWWMLAGFIIGFSYSGGPLKLGFRGLGELVIFVIFGPLMMTGVYYAITGDVTPKIAWLSASVGLLVTNIVYTHSVLDAVPDQKMGKFTMAHLMGSDKGMMVLSGVFNVLPYILVMTGVILGQLHPAYLAVLIVLPLSIWLYKSLYSFVLHIEVPIEPKWWMGPMGDFDRFRKAGLDWFILRWLVARNVVQFFCLIAAVVSLIFG
jgi:1,4-dihydroxy-2-naphthoate octaprenyltransferase